MTQKEQRFVAIKGVIDRVLWTAGATESNRKLLANAISDELAAYTAAVEAKRDKEIANLKNKLAWWESPNDAKIFAEVKKQASHKDSLAAQTIYIVHLERRIKEITKKLVEQQAIFHEKALFSDPQQELIAILAKERERCEKLHDREDVLAPIGNSSYGEAYQDGWIAGTSAYQDAIRSLK